MKKTDAKVYQISEILQWAENKELELSPKYQRAGTVWNDKAKSYLIDTIIRGLPIPPIFLRQRIDVPTRTIFREIIDGQQRIRAILEYVVEDKFPLMKSQNKDYGGKKYSDLDEDAQEALLEYEILAEIVPEKEDSIIYDMFSRLNSNNYALNRQEIRNALYWGDFKVFVYRLTSVYRKFFTDKHILSDRDCSRMRDAELIASLLILLMEGIVDGKPAAVDKIYRENDAEFKSMEVIEEKFNAIMEVIISVYDYLNGNSGCFDNKNFFYTFFAVIANQMFGLANSDFYRNELFHAKNIKSNLTLLNNVCVQFINDYEQNISDTKNLNGLHDEFSRFDKLQDTRTTGKSERMERVEFLNKRIGFAAYENE